MLDAEMGGFGDELDDDFDAGFDNAAARRDDDDDDEETSDEEDVSTLDALDRAFLSKIDPAMAKAMQAARVAGAAKTKERARSKGKGEGVEGGTKGKGGKVSKKARLVATE
jgi:hypothetical protein